MPRPRKIKNVGPKISDTLAARLLDVLRHGRPAFDANGCPVLDDDGNPVMRPPSNADFKIALDWLKFHGERGAHEEHRYQRSEEEEEASKQRVERGEAIQREWSKLTPSEIAKTSPEDIIARIKMAE